MRRKIASAFIQECHIEYLDEIHNEILTKRGMKNVIVNRLLFYHSLQLWKPA